MELKNKILLYLLVILQELIIIIWRFGKNFPLKSGESEPKFGDKLWIVCLCVCERNESACNPGSSDRIAHVGKMGDGIFIFISFCDPRFFYFAGVFLAPLIPKGRVGGGHGGHKSQILFLPTWYQVADQCSPYPRRPRPWWTSVFLPTWY